MSMLPRIGRTRSRRLVAHVALVTLAAVVAAALATPGAADPYGVTVQHAGPNQSPAVPSQAGPSDGSATNSPPALFAVFTDPDGDAGVVDFRLCAEPACATVLETDTDAVLDGDTASTAIATRLAWGTYYWQARALDEHGAASAWSTAASFRLNARPLPATAVSPGAGTETRDSTPRLAAEYADRDGDAGTIVFRVCRNVAVAGSRCTELVRRGTSASVPSGGTGSWSPRMSIVDGTHQWQARSVDGLGRRSAWTATRALVVEKKLVRIVNPRHLRCVVGASFRPTLRLAEGARLAVRLITESRVDQTVAFGWRAAGEQSPRVTLSWGLARPAVYWVKWTARRADERGAAWMRLDVEPYRGGTPACRPA